MARPRDAAVGGRAVSGRRDTAGGVIVGPDPVWVPATKALLYAAIATLVVGTLVLGRADRYARMLGSRPMVWLGEISYEIFLLHVVVMA